MQISLNWAKYLGRFMKDTLFLLSPGFNDGEGAPYYCPACTIFEGLLHLYPQLAEQIEVHRVDFPRPRPQIIALIGEENQSCPVLVLGTPSKGTDLNIKRSGARQFIDDPQAIGHYLSEAYGIPRPH